MPETTCRAAAEADELRAALEMAKGEVARLEAERDGYWLALVAIRAGEQSVCEAWHEFIARLREIAADALAVRAATGPDGEGGR